MSLYNIWDPLPKPLNNHQREAKRLADAERRATPQPVPGRPGWFTIDGKLSYDPIQDPSYSKEMQRRADEELRKATPLSAKATLEEVGKITQDILRGDAHTVKVTGVHLDGYEVIKHSMHVPDMNCRAFVEKCAWVRSTLVSMGLLRDGFLKDDSALTRTQAVDVIRQKAESFVELRQLVASVVSWKTTSVEYSRGSTYLQKARLCLTNTQEGFRIRVNPGWWDAEAPLGVTKVICNGSVTKWCREHD